MSTRRKVILWILTIVPAAVFLFGGTMKLSQPAVVGPMFQHYGYPPWFAVVTGIMEVTGSLLVLMPRSAWAGATVLGAVAIGATLTHLTHHEPANAVVPFVLLAMLSAVFYLRREGLLRLLGRTPRGGHLARKGA